MALPPGYGIMVGPYIYARNNDVKIPLDIPPVADFNDDPVKRHGADTIGAMACAIWGAGRGAESIPATMLEQVEDHQRLQALSDRFADAIESSNQSTGNDQ
jgi:hypothetical protein